MSDSVRIQNTLNTLKQWIKTNTMKDNNMTCINEDNNIDLYLNSKFSDGFHCRIGEIWLDSSSGEKTQP